MAFRWSVRPVAITGFIPVYTDNAENDPTAEHGYIDAVMLRKYIADVTALICYLSGPAGMVKAMRNMLVDVEANEDNIRTEEFSGY